MTKDKLSTVVDVTVILQATRMNRKCSRSSREVGGKDSPSSLEARGNDFRNFLEVESGSASSWVAKRGFPNFSAANEACHCRSTQPYMSVTQTHDDHASVGGTIHSSHFYVDNIKYIYLFFRVNVLREINESCQSHASPTGYGGRYVYTCVYLQFTFAFHQFYSKITMDIFYSDCIELDTALPLNFPSLP